jgi:hypothetical protein
MTRAAQGELSTWAAPECGVALVRAGAISRTGPTVEREDRRSVAQQPPADPQLLTISRTARASPGTTFTLGLSLKR